MAIYVITGNPGSGKTYYAVAHLVKKNFFWDKKLLEYLPKWDLTIITNIDSLKLDHLNLDDLLKDVPFEKFFTIDFFKKLRRRYPRIVLVVDESQRFFGTHLKNPEVEFFFQYHRHLGLDIYLITQSLDLLSKKIRALIETEVHALPRSFQPGRFVYKKLVAGEVVGRVSLPRDQRIFRLYKSMDLSETEKAGSYALKYIYITLALFLFSIIAFYYFLKTLPSHAKSSVISSQSQKISQKIPLKQNLAKSNSKTYLRTHLPGTCWAPLHLLNPSSSTPVFYTEDGTHFSALRFRVLLESGYARFAGGRYWVRADLTRDPCRWCPSACSDREHADKTRATR